MGRSASALPQYNLTIIGNGSGIASFQQANLVTVGNGSGIADIAQSAMAVVGDGAGMADIAQTFVSVVRNMIPSIRNQQEPEESDMETSPNISVPSAGLKRKFRR